MKIKGLIIALLLSCVWGFAEANFPEPIGFVNDFANILTDSEEAALTEIAERVEGDTTAEMAIVTVQTVQPLSIEEYSVRLFEKWGIGKKGKDNGVLLLVAVEDRAVKIEVGYGLEGVLPDGLCGEIIRKFIIPEFKMGRFGSGIIAGVSEIASVVSGKKVDYGGVHGAEPEIVGKIKGFVQSVMILFFIAIFVLIGLLQAFFPRRRRWSTRSGSSSWGSSSGGGFGSFGGGGFGGFGGGGSGGGGAVGRW